MEERFYPYLVWKAALTEFCFPTQKLFLRKTSLEALGANCLQEGTCPLSHCGQNSLKSACVRRLSRGLHCQGNRQRQTFSVWDYSGRFRPVACEGTAGKENDQSS